MFHAIITRFNLSIKYNGSIGNVDGIDTCRDENYLSNRFEIFEKYTFPSVIAQSCREFKWIVMFHQETPERFKEKLKELEEKGRGIFVPLYMTEEECAKASVILNAYLKKQAEDRGETIVVTTRMDNDDAIHRDYVKEIQKSVLENGKKQNSYYINFNNGLQWIPSKGFLRKFYYPNNHFLSLVTPIENLRNALEFSHGFIDREYKQCQGKSTEPMWIEMIHTSNYMNSEKINIFQMYWDYDVLEKFQIDASRFLTRKKIKIMVKYLPATLYYLIYQGARVVYHNMKNVMKKS